MYPGVIIPLPGQHHSQLLGLRAETARSRVEVEIIDAELEMIWLADLGSLEKLPHREHHSVAR